MTQALIEEPALAEPAARATIPFSSKECAALHKEDQTAAAGVAGIMITIFMLAVIGYTIIAVLAALGPT